MFISFRFASVLLPFSFRYAGIMDGSITSVTSDLLKILVIPPASSHVPSVFQLITSVNKSLVKRLNESLVSFRYPSVLLPFSFRYAGESTGKKDGLN